MKKVFLTMVAAGMALSAMAVDLPKQGLGLQIGWAQPILRLNSPDSGYPSDSLVNTVKLNGFKVGFTYDASYIAGFGSSMGINYTFGAYSGGWQSKKANQQATYPLKRQMFTYNEIEVFVDWQYKFEVAKETYLILYTGPTLQCGLTLDMRVDERQMDEWGDVKTDLAVHRYSGYTTDNQDNAMKRLNVTWGVGAGFQYKRYFLRGGYDFGLINPYKNRDFTNDRHTRGRLDQWNIKVGIYLWYHE